MEISPFEFFELPRQVQYEFLLTMDIGSIHNLCEASISNKGSKFFIEICNNNGFWEAKFERDFPDDYHWFGDSERRINWKRKYLENLEDSLIVAAGTGDIETVRDYIKAGVNPDVSASYDLRKSDFVYDTPLSAASKNNHVEIVQTLLDAYADPNYYDDYDENNTPLLEAISAENKTIVLKLLEAKADPNVETHDGRLIDYATEDIAKILINYGAVPYDEFAYVEDMLG